MSDSLLHQTDDRNFSWAGLRRRMRSIDNLKVLPLRLQDLAGLLEASPAEEVWKLVGEQVGRTDWKGDNWMRMVGRGTAG